MPHKLTLPLLVVALATTSSAQFDKVLQRLGNKAAGQKDSRTATGLQISAPGWHRARH
jgi:hypothetical protein